MTTDVTTAERVLPTGQVTFLFTDIEGSTRLLRELGDRFSPLLEDHQRILREAFDAGGGVEVHTAGDGFMVAFSDPRRALEAAVGAQEALASHPWPEEGRITVRMGLHTGEGTLGGDDYVGLDVHRAARIGDAGHGGQLLLSAATGALVGEILPEGVTLRDLGHHTLKDLEPEHLFQVVVEGLRSTFPPIRSLAGALGNLPTKLTSFVGREAEIAAVVQMLQDGARLLTLTGPGGTGKTRLALRVASDLLTEFAHGAYFVDLAHVTDPAFVVPAIADTLGVTESTQRPLLDSLVDQLGDRHLLLVLDNFEQVVEAGAAVERLIREAPQIRVLVTSREVLRREGEAEFAVPPLPVPEPGQIGDLAAITRNEAVALFLDRASDVNPAFELTADNAEAVVEICARLDGLPLAIELASSRIKLLTAQQILDRLGERLTIASRVAGAPDRQKTLRDAIEWSYELLDSHEQRLFQDLSVFRGGATLEAVEEACAPGTLAVLDVLASLIDKSLVRQVETDTGESRYVMLETIREYGLDRLVESDREDDLARQHASHFLRLAEAAEPELVGPDGPRWLSRLNADHDNLRGALRWSLESGEVATGMTLAGALWRFWQQRSHFEEARGWLDRLTEHPAASDDTRARFAVFTGLGGIAYWQGDYATAERAYQEALKTARQLGDQRLIGQALTNASYMPVLARGDVAMSRRLGEEAAEVFEELGDSDEANRLRGEAGYYSMMEGDLERAREILEPYYQRSMQSDDMLVRSLAQHVLGQLERLSNNASRARALYCDSIRTYLPREDLAGLLEPVEALGSVASMQGDHVRAVRLVAATDAAREELGGGPPPEWLMPFDVMGRARESLDQSTLERAVREGRAMTLEEAIDYALSEG